MATIDPEKPNVPATDAVQVEKSVASWLPAMFVHVTAAEFATDPPDAAAQVTCLRVVSVAAFDVPAEPGAPVCNFIHGYAAAIASSAVFAPAEPNPSATGRPQFCEMVDQFLAAPLSVLLLSCETDFATLRRAAIHVTRLAVLDVTRMVVGLVADVAHTQGTVWHQDFAAFLARFAGAAFDASEVAAAAFLSR